MRLLLDTHILIWWHDNIPRLNDRGRTIIREADAVFVSMVSAWEASIKVSKGKMKLSDPIEIQIQANGFQPIGLEFSHMEQVMKLPWLHCDPFDRMLIAQAQCEDLYLITDDKIMTLYDVKRIEI